jgi:two-component system, OmpR family, copper resistance phosphate regulon response regulator CusR
MKILVIEDEYKVASFIKKGLEESGFPVDLAMDGPTGEEKALNEFYNLIILDINLPGINGIDLCRNIRKEKQTPVLMLTALGTIDDKVNGLDSGADDYLVKPFEFRELLARIRALTRRVSEPETPVYRIADLELNIVKKTVSRAGISIDLTAREFTLLEYFLKNKERVLSRAELAEHVWSLNFDTGTNIIDVYINYLRRKVDRDFSPRLIHTIVGMGYVLREGA